MKSELETRLDALQLTISSLSHGIDDSGKWLHFSWSVTLGYEGRTLTTSYSSGIGNSKGATFVDKGRTLVSTPHGNVTLETAAKEGYVKPTPPKVADVLASLFSSSADADESFNDWCANLGLDTDSRSALKSYLDCQETRSRLVKFLGRSLFNELSQLQH